MRPPIGCDGLSARFGPGHPVFSSVSLSVATGEVLALFGPNGCGKSTLLRRLLGLGAGEGERWAEGRVGWVPQRVRASFFAWASLRENLRLVRPAGDAGRAQQDARIDAMAEKLGVQVDLGRRPGEVSDGTLQQVAWVRALAVAPRVLVADEPFAAVDVAARARLGEALRELAREEGLAALLVLHDLDSLLRVADRVLVIEGRPFSTEPVAGHTVARLVENGRAGRSARAADTGLASILERLLAEAPLG